MKTMTPKTTSRMFPLLIANIYARYPRKLLLANTESAKIKVIPPKMVRAQTVAAARVLRKDFIKIRTPYSAYPGTHSLSEHKCKV